MGPTQRFDDNFGGGGGGPEGFGGGFNHGIF
jgi:hypothetical protein